MYEGINWIVGWSVIEFLLCNSMKLLLSDVWIGGMFSRLGVL